MKGGNFFSKSELIIKIFEDYGQEFKFSIGQLICTDRYLPGNIYLIKEGQARLIINHEGLDTTLKKLIPGDVVGLASLLKGKSCEEVRASEELIALSISDEQFLNLYRDKLSLRRYCDQKIWEPELIFLTKKFLEDKNNKELKIKEIYEKISKEVEIIPFDQKQIKNALENRRRLFLSSFDNNFDEGIEINKFTKLDAIKNNKNNFSTRIISISEEFFKKYPILKESFNRQLNSKKNKFPRKTQEIPPISSLNQIENEDKILVKGEGPIDGTLACFQMLSNLLAFPFRKDSIEKVLKEFFEENNFISLQLCAKIASYHSLRVSISKLNSNFITRIKTPALIKWKNSFAIIINSNQKGIKLATPIEGLLSFNKAEIKKIFKEDIEILLLERTNFTQNKSFGPSWFFPQLKNIREFLFRS